MPQSYERCILPFAVACLLVPTLDLTRLTRRQDANIVARLLATLQQEVLRLLPPNGLKDHFVYSEQAFKAGRWWTVLTHMLAHSDLSHLMNNLISLAFTGRQVRAHLGVAGFYTVFLGGGVVAALNKSTRQLQIQRQYAAMLKLPESWGWVSRLPNNLTEKGSSIVAEYTRPEFTYVGCSAGIMSLLGFDLMLCLEDIIFSRVRASVLLRAAESAAMVASDYHNLVNGRGSGIDNAGHIDGFICGLGCYVLWGVVRLAARRRDRARSRFGGGHRLGGRNRDSPWSMGPRSGIQRGDRKRRSRLEFGTTCLSPSLEWRYSPDLILIR